MSCFDTRKPWDNGSLFMSTFDIENYATKDSLDDVIENPLISCKMADQAINKAMGKV
jgi:hypothetical protein